MRLWIVAALPGVWLAAIVIALLVEPSIVEDNVAIATATIASVIVPKWFGGSVQPKLEIRHCCWINRDSRDLLID